MRCLALTQNSEARPLTCPYASAGFWLFLRSLGRRIDSICPRPESLTENGKPNHKQPSPIQMPNKKRPVISLITEDRFLCISAITMLNRKDQ